MFVMFVEMFVDVFDKFVEIFDIFEFIVFCELKRPAIRERSIDRFEAT